MKREEALLTNEIFIEIEDLLTLVKENSTLKSREEIFIGLFYWIYEENGLAPSIKDALYDRTRRRTPFSTELQSFATTYNIDNVHNYIYKKIGTQIRNGSKFAHKLYYIIQKDNFSFSDISDLQTERVNDCIYLLSYMAIKLIIFSDIWTKYAHSDDYNPFLDYREDDTVFTSVTTSVADTALKELSNAHYSHYFEEKNFDISFKSELLTQGVPYVIDKSFRFFTNDLSINTSKKEQTIEEITASSEQNILLIGEGGIGKTTFLLSHLKKLCTNNTNIVPLYIKLSDCSSNNDHRRIIINSLIEQMGLHTTGNNLPSYFDVINSFKTSSCKYVLLLDGFNEITTLDSGEIRYSIANEINELLKLQNIQIILSSREVDFYGLSLNKFNVIKATGVSKEIIDNYISAIYTPEICLKINANTELMTLLHNPLFLLMFTHTVSPNVEEKMLPRNRGSILFQYFNSTSSFYTEMNKDTNPNNLFTSAIITFLLDFVVPDLGYFMESNEAFSISEEIFDNIFYTCQNDSRCKIKHCPPEIKAHYHRPYDLQKTFTEVKKLSSDDIILLICDGLNILTRDNEGKLYFCHQYIRDYFSAYYFIRESAALNSIATLEPQSISSNDITWGDTLWDDEKNNLLYEIIDFDNKILSSNDLVKTLSLFKTNKRFHLKLKKYEIANIIEVLALLYHADLSFLDLSYLDLSTTNITGKNFYNSSLKQTANFTGAIISHDTCMIEGHLSGINKWAISDDERYIISISNHREIKVWNIATQRCIYTREHIPFCEHELPFNSISSCSLHKNGTLALFTLYDSITKSTKAFSYDFAINQFTEYKPTNGLQDFVLFTYEASDDTIIATTRTHYISFLCNCQNPTQEIVLSEHFIDMLNIERYYCPDSFQRFNAYKVYALDDEHLLYCFTDNNAPELADTFEKEYDELYLDENNPPDNNYYERRDYHHEQYLEMRDTERHINYYIYNIYSQKLSLLHLDCDLDSEFSLYFAEDTTSDAIEKFTAISKNGRFIVLHNNQDIYKYDLYGDTDCIFEKVCALPHGYRRYDMKFCHLNYDHYLSLYDHNNVLHLDILTGNLLLEKDYPSSSMGGYVSLTDNFLLESERLSYNSDFIITNIFSGNSTTFSLSSFGQILEYITSTSYNRLHVLYDNGSIFTYDTQSRTLVDSYNFTYKQHLSAHVYDKSEHAVYCSCSPHHDYMYSNKHSIIKIDIDSRNKPLESARSFSAIKKLYLYPNRPYILAFTDVELLLFNKDTLELLSRFNISEYVDYRTPEDVIYNPESQKVYAVYADGHKRYYNTFGKMIPIEINNEEISIGPSTFIPVYTPDETCPPLFVKQIPYSSLCFIKTFDEDYDDFVKYYSEDVQGQNVFRDEMECIYRNITDWCLVYLEVPNHSNEMFYEGKYLELRDSDSLILSPSFMANNLLIEQEHRGYEFDIAKNERTELSFVNLSDLTNLTYDSSNRIIYCTMNKEREIHFILIKENCITDTETPVPELLVFGCDFFNCQLASDVKINMLAASGAILHSK